jgi:hypothetical protein
MEDNLNFFYMEDDLNILETEDDLNFKKMGRRPQFLKMEDNYIYFLNGR